MRGCSVGCTIAMSDISLVFIVAAGMSIGVSRNKKMHFEAGVFWVRRDFGQVSTGGGLGKS